MRAGRRGALVGALSCALLLALVLGTTPQAARADDPTWAEVQAAKKDVRQQSGVVARIERALDAVEAEAARLGSIALQKAQAARDAQARLDAAKAAVGRLQDQERAAQGQADAARRTAGAVATQMYRSGDPTLSVWLAGRGSGSLLYRLGALDQIGEASSSLLDRATEQRRLADALGRQASAQAAVRDELSTRATSASNAAKAAQRAADAQVARTKARRATLLAQLKSLKAKSASLQTSYRQAQEAKRAAAAAGRGGGGGSLSGIAAGPDSLSPGAAQSYAASRLGAYGWGGGQMSCLARLWTIESGWRWDALNASSGAYGIPQSLPGSKMSTSGGDWTTSARTQIEWGLGYIQARYSSPCGALSFETSHVPYWY